MILLGVDNLDIEEDNLEEAPVETEGGAEKDQEEEEEKEEAGKKLRFDPSQVEILRLK